MSTRPTAEIDRRFSDPDAGATPWSEAARTLQRAELLPVHSALTVIQRFGDGRCVVAR